MAPSAAAATATEEPRGCGCHIVAVPFPGRGHVNAMMNLSRLLAARGAEVSFVVTEEWLGLLLASSSAPPDGVRLRAIPNVIPSEHGRAADHSGFLDAVATEMETPFERLLDSLDGPPPAALVADTYLPWVVGVGNRRGVQVWSLFPMPATFFSAFYHYDLLPAWLTDEHATDSCGTLGEVPFLPLALLPPILVDFCTNKFLNLSMIFLNLDMPRSLFQLQILS
jgi:hypothetical protein